MKLLGAILAGGHSRRFGGDKALAEIEGRPLIAHVAEALAAQTNAVVVCGREWGGLAWLPDRPRADMGPLGGLCAALHHAAREGYDAVLSAGCDTLPVPEDLAGLLWKKCHPLPLHEVVEGSEDCAPISPLQHLLEGSGVASSPFSPAYLLDQPTLALWPAALAPLLDAHLAATTDLSLRHWARISGAIGVNCDATLTNLNTPDDLARYVAERAGEEMAHGLS